MMSDHECAGDRNFLVTLSYNVSDVCSHEEAADEFWQWLASTKDPVVSVSEVPLGSQRSDPQEFDRNGRFDA